MNKAKFQKLLLPIGLLFLSGSSLINHFYKLPDFVLGFSMGLGITLMLGYFYIHKFKKPAA